MTVSGMSMTALNYDALDRSLQEADALSGPAEVHGLLFGMVCGPQLPALQDWVPLILGEDFADIPSHKPLLAQLATALVKTRLQLSSDDAFALTLMLPSEDAPLRERTEALAAWCQGFILGLRLANAPQPLPGEAQELVNDLTAITQAHHDPRGKSQAQEKEFTELEEYVRMGVTYIYTELHAPDQSA